MNLDKMFVWITAIVIAFAAAGKLAVLQNWIWQAQAKVIYESRTSTWGRPRFFRRHEVIQNRPRIVKMNSIRTLRDEGCSPSAD